MSWTTSDYASVDERISALGCVFPDGLAMLPNNFEWAAARTEFRMPDAGSTIRTVLRNGGLPTGSLLPPGERAPTINNNSSEWIGPTIFVSASLASQDPNAVSVALGLITNYLTDFFKGRPEPKSAKLAFVIERKRDRVCKKLDYEGPVEGLAALAEIARQMSDD